MLFFFFFWTPRQSGLASGRAGSNPPDFPADFQKKSKKLHPTKSNTPPGNFLVGKNPKIDKFSFFYVLNFFRKKIPHYQKSPLFDLFSNPPAGIFFWTKISKESKKETPPKNQTPSQDFQQTKKVRPGFNFFGGGLLNWISPRLLESSLSRHCAKSCGQLLLSLVEQQEHELLPCYKLARKENPRLFPKFGTTGVLGGSNLHTGVHLLSCGLKPADLGGMGVDGWAPPPLEGGLLHFLHKAPKIIRILKLTLLFRDGSIPPLIDPSGAPQGVGGRVQTSPPPAPIFWVGISFQSPPPGP